MDLNVSSKLTTANRSPTAKISAPQAIRNSTLALWLGLLVVVITLALLPFVARTWRATGDEPHYLLTAHSLVTDRDFDLSNNYDRFDYLNFYFSPDITRQIRFNRQREQILDHQLGLPVLIAPAYALGGRLGVLFFQALLGGLLAVVTFKLAVFISQDQQAALLATLFVALTPPLFLYHCLVYPELIAALLTTAIVYLVVSQDKPNRYTALVVFLSLALLPWLNRRFAMLALVLALLVVWAWRDRERPLYQGRLFSRIQSSPLWGVGGGWPGLAVTGLSIGLLLWFNSSLMAPERVDITLPMGGDALWPRLMRGIGWLVDQQRGLLIYGPVYIAAIFGLPYILDNSRRWFVAVPFFVSLGVTTLAGGFWVAWELGPRFLVVALPALAPLLALAWRHYGRTIVGGGAILLLFGLSLINSWVIVTHFELPYKSSLPLFYGEKLAIPLTEYLPDLGENLEILPDAGNVGGAELITEEGGQVWFAPIGRPVNLAQTEPLHGLPFGHYRLNWQLRTDPGLSPQTEVLRTSVQMLGGGQLFSQIITAADLPADGGYGEVTYTFLNTNVDRWRTPLVLHAVSTGQSNIWVKRVSFQPVPFFAWLLPYLYLGSCLGGAYLAWWWRRRTGGLKDQESNRSSRTTLSDLRPSLLGSSTVRRPGTRTVVRSEQKSTFLIQQDNFEQQGEGRWLCLSISPAWSGKIGWVLALLLPVAAFGYLIIQQAQPGRTYDAADFLHFVGRPIDDREAADGRAWLVDPLSDPPQKAIYGPFDFFEPGQYYVSFRIKLVEAVEPDWEVARLRVSATANFDELISQPLLANNFSEPDLYHLFVLTVTNPRRQALSFEVDYTGQAALVIDEVIVEEINQ